MLKLRLFAATVESVLLYGCEAWTVTPELAKDLDGCYTHMPRTVPNIHWKQHAELYGDLPKISQKIRERRTRFAGHCARSDEPVSMLVCWIPKHGGKEAWETCPYLHWHPWGGHRTGGSRFQDSNAGQKPVESHCSSGKSPALSKLVRLNIRKVLIHL